MGLCASTPEDEVNKEIDREMRKDYKFQEDTHKLLLLGAGQSGKSTVFKQMVSLYGEGFNEQELASYRPIIYVNTLASMQTLVKESSKRASDGKANEYGIAPELADDVNLVLSVQLQGVHSTFELDEKFAQAIARLWKDKGILATYEVRSEFQLNDSAIYYFNKVEELGKYDYIPTEADVMRSRARTTGVIEQEFDVAGHLFRIFDVGGQRSERKKWIHCFEGVSGVLFVAAISTYDEVLFEDGVTNRMVEALTLFDEVCNSEWFTKAAIVLFLNKRDLFAEKIEKKPITVSPAFEDYDGDDSFEETTAYITRVFEDQNRNDQKRIYPHLTCATDRDNVLKVFDSVKDTVLHKGLVDAGIVAMN